MLRLTAFELRKIWGKPSFILALCMLLFVNLFLLWYVNLPGEASPPLSAYKAFGSDIAAMDDAEKADYIRSLKKQIDGVAFVQSIQSMQAMGTEMGTALARQEMDANPGLFDAYYGLYQSGNYLTYTDSLTKESALIDTLCNECTKVSGYADYLSSVQRRRDDLTGISIFGGSDTFSTRNIRKSAADYEGLENTVISWQPSKGLTAAMESGITDVLLFLGLFLFTGSLIREEKEKGLFFITRATKNGMAVSVCAKLGALFLHCLAATVLMLGGNLLFCAAAAGLGDLTVSIQSIAPYMESSLRISVLQYIGLSALTKSLTLFSFGAFLTAVSLCAGKSFVPYLSGLAVLALSWAAWAVIPGNSPLSGIKYLNPISLVETGQLYGGYLNLNLGGYPISRLTLSWLMIGIQTAGMTAACLLCFPRRKSLEVKNARIPLPVRFRPHGNLLRHEAYKLLIMNRGLLVLAFFAALLGCHGLSREYRPSAQELYYQRLMLRLEGSLDGQKEDLLLSEQARFAEAFRQMEEIDALAAAGALDAASADAMKLEWESALSLYPAFQRAWQQYVRIQERGGGFVYDTGFLYLFGTMDDSFLINLLLISVCMVLAFHNAISMEYSKNAWLLLGTSKGGWRTVLAKKVLICLLCAAGITVLPWAFRGIRISETFPMRGLLNSIQDIPAFADFGLNIPTACFIFLVVLTQVLSVITVTLIVLALSLWRKNDMQALFFGFFLLVVPLVLKMMGFDFAGWISVYPLYACTG